MSALQTFVDDGWARHTEAPQGVADRLPEGLALVSSEQDVVALANLGHHVWGAHLGQWEQGIAFVRHLTEQARAGGHLPPGSEADPTCRRLTASLLLCQGSFDGRDALSACDHIFVTAMASAALASHDTPRALSLMNEALLAAQAAGLPDSDPVNRALAVTTNNLAATLEEQPVRSDEERHLMIAAAQAARRYWAIAGTWLHVERAEFRLAHTWLKAGDPTRALGHARSCLAIVAEHQGAPLERFFGHEPLVLAERALGNDAGADAAISAMRVAFAELSDDDRAWCAETLHKLGA